MNKSKIIKFLTKRNILLPLIASGIGIILTYFITSDITSDTVLSLICGSSDIEVSDFYNRIRAGSSKKNIDNQIVVVNIDSIFDRKELAILIQEVSQQQPKAIALDVIFDSEKDPDSDEILAEILNSTPNLVISQKYNDYDYAPSQDFISAYAPEVKRGIANLTATTHHGLVREFTPFFGENNEYPCFAASILQNVAPNEYKRVENRKDDEMIRFQPEEFYIVDPYEVCENNSLFKGKIVFFGTINEEADLHRTPLSEDYPGVLIQANILAMMLRDDYINKSSDIYNFLLGLISCLLISMLYVGLDTTQNLAMRVVPIVWMIIIVIVGCWCFNEWGIYLNAPQTILLAALSLLVLDFWLALETPVKRIWNKLFLNKNKLIQIKI